MIYFDRVRYRPYPYTFESLPMYAKRLLSKARRQFRMNRHEVAHPLVRKVNACFPRSGSACYDPISSMLDMSNMVLLDLYGLFITGACVRIAPRERRTIRTAAARSPLSHTSVTSIVFPQNSDTLLFVAAHGARVQYRAYPPTVDTHAQRIPAPRLRCRV
jgi:hypothetical protein